MSICRQTLDCRNLFGPNFTARKKIFYLILFSGADLKTETRTVLYCNAPILLSSPIKRNCTIGSTKEFAAIAPEAATPGNPIPVRITKKRTREDDHFEAGGGWQAMGGGRNSCISIYISPGKVVSPHANRPDIGVLGPGSSHTSFPSDGAGP